MIGITSYGAYVPPTRLSLAAISGRPGKDGGPEKAVAWNDEDSVTMGVSAVVNCLRAVAGRTISHPSLRGWGYPNTHTDSRSGKTLSCRGRDFLDGLLRTV